MIFTSIVNNFAFEFKINGMESIKIAEQLALKNKYDEVMYYSQWNECDVFVAENKTENEAPRIGYPAFIIVDKNQARFASSYETLDIMEIHPIEDKNYSGEML